MSYVYTSIPIYVEGYRPLDLKYINESGEEEYPKMLVTKLSSDVQDYKEDIGTKTITIEDEVTELELTFQPPKEQNYIFAIKNFFDLEQFDLQIKHYNYEVICLNAGYESSTESATIKTDTYSFEDKGTYYFHIKRALSTSDMDNIVFTFTIRKKVLDSPLTGLTNSQYELV